MLFEFVTRASGADDAVDRNRQDRTVTQGAPRPAVGGRMLQWV